MTEPKLTRGETRRAARRRTAAPSTMRTAGAAPIDVTALDVSTTGVRIRTAASLMVGQEISIGLAGAGMTRAYVAWRRGDEYGCAFENPLDPDAEARAFSSVEPVHLGSTIMVLPESEGQTFEELYRQHRHLKLPLDAVFALAVAFALLAGSLYITLKP